jgi:hypothetical protein
MISVSMQKELRPVRRDNVSRNALLFILFCIACVTFLGVFLAAYVYWGIHR